MAFDGNAAYDLSRFDTEVNTGKEKQPVKMIDIFHTLYAKDNTYRLLMVGQGENYQDKPDFEGNFSFAARVTQAINQKADGLCREVLVRTGRYNQHVGTPAVLVEVGHNENTLEEALGSVAYLAEGIVEAMKEGR